MANPFKFRADHAGALIVPAELQKAREDYTAGSLDEAALHEIEEKCVANALELQTKAVIDVFSDGELLRGDYVAELKDALVEGVDAAVAVAESQAITLKREIAILKRNVKTKGTNYNFKISVVAPGFLIGHAYRTLDAETAKAAAQALAEKLVPLVSEELKFLASEKVPYTQMINPSYGYLLNTGNHADLSAKGIDPATVLDEVMAADQAVFDSVDRSGDEVIGQTVCKGAKEPWYRSDGHEILAEKFFANFPVDRFNVIFGDAADTVESDFSALKFIPEESVLSVGVMNSKNTDLEDADDVLDRLDEVDEVHAQPNMSLSIQGDFRAHGDEDTQFKKLQFAAVLARRYWGFEM